MSKTQILSKSDEKDNLRAAIVPYLKNWKWFLISVIIALIIGHLKIRYSVPEYAATTKIQILQDENSSSELSALKDLEALTGGGSSNVEDELEILNSKSNFIEVVKDLKLNVRIFEKGSIVDSEFYQNAPFVISFTTPDSSLHKQGHFFRIEVASPTTFRYYKEDQETFKLFDFGKNIPSKIGNIVITPAIDGIEKLSGRTFEVNVQPVMTAAKFFQNKILLELLDENSTIVNISILDNVPKRAIDVLNNLVINYNEKGVIDKKAVADRTSLFINKRISDISSNLSNVDQRAEDFKSNRGLTNIVSQADLNMNLGAETEQQLQNASIQLDIASSMQEIVNSQDGYEVLPSNIGLSDLSISNTTAKYNELVAERNRLLESSNEKNPIIVNLDQELGSLKRNMQSSLNSMTNNLGLRVNNLSKQKSTITSRIYSAPRNERALRDITRKQQTTEALYLYLLQRREESQIAYASASPKSDTIDSSYIVSGKPESPKPTLIFLSFFILGLLLPFSIIYIVDLMDNKVHSKDQLEKLLKNAVPVIGELPKLNKKKIGIVQDNDRSVLAESLRILRTNISYILSSKKIGINEGAVIYVTSSVPGEGKTFVASNLSKIFSTSNKKVLLLGADIRNPKIYEFYEGGIEKRGKLKKMKRHEELGLTNFLVNSDVEIRDIIFESKLDGSPDLIYSGKIPPNPAEVLLSERLPYLFKQLRKSYDYIIVDTAPIIAVTDTTLISGLADYILYVSRAGVTDVNVLNHPMALYEEGKLPNLAFVVNGVKDSNLGYGGKYGYGYGQEKRKWWKVFSKS
jgi:capsular exopolysaccharide synthesis family protein